MNALHSTGIPGSNAACEVSCRLLHVNFAVIMTRAGEAKTEAFQAIEGLSRSGFRTNFHKFNESTKGSLLLFNQIFDFIQKKGYIASKFS